MKADVQLHAALGKAVQLWMDYHGYDPDKKVWQLGDYEVRKTYEELEEAQELDQSGLTAAMLLRSFVDWRARSNEYTVKDLLERREAVEADVAKIKAMVDILESPIVTNAVNSFIKWLRAGCEHYGMKGDELEELLEDPFSLAFVRRDAILASGKLSVHWFAHGEPAEEAPQYAKDVYQWWNVNSLLAGLGRIGDAITLNLIRDAIGEFSYFAFGCRHGGNLLVLTDKTDHAHPLQKGMARKPGRDLERRAFQYRFPYHLLNFVTDYKGDMHVPRQDGLVPYNAEAVKLGQLTDLTADEMAWIVMMLQLIYEQHLQEPPEKPLLSYTGEMIVEPKLLQEQARNLPTKWEGTQLSLPDTKLEDLTYENVEKIVEREPTRWAEWMVGRYGDKVDPNLLDMVGDGDVLQLPGNHRFSRRGDSIQLKGIDPVEFGTRDQLQSDRLWLARYNQAKQIEVAAQQEFEDRKEEIQKWFRKTIKKNAPALVQAVVTGKLPGKVYAQGDCVFDFSALEWGNLLRVNVFENAHPDFYWNAPWGDWCVRLGAAGSPGYTYYCYVSGERATVFGKLRPNNAEALATVCGCTVAKLPDVLQHYETNTPYTGNHLLDRIDPMEWAVHNPWSDIQFRVMIALSKRTVHRVRKEMGLPRLRPDDWQKLRFNSDQD